MPIIVYRDYVATRSGTARKKVTCEKCGQEFAYEIQRTVEGHGSSPLRRGAGPIDGQVWAGHYRCAHRWHTAADAAAEFMASDSPEGWEVVVPRRIAAAEIHRVRTLRQVVGWRYLDVQPDTVIFRQKFGHGLFGGRSPNRCTWRIGLSTIPPSPP